MKKLLIILLMFVVGVNGLNVGVAKAAEVTEKREWEMPEIYIKAVNPGFTNKNEGEMIELGAVNASAENLVSLAGYKVSYTRNSGESIALSEFSEHMFVTGESILMRYASSPESELAHFLYKNTLVISDGKLELIKGDTVVDAVCWGMDGCMSKFDSKKQRNLVRDELTGEFVTNNDYLPEYVPEALLVEASEEGKGGADGGGEESEATSSGQSRCKGAVFSEILSYYAESKTEQFIEFYNGGTEKVALDGCTVRYKNKSYALNGMVGAEGYFAWYMNEFNLTKNPTNANTLELIDADGTVLDTLEYPNGQRKGTAWAFIGYDTEGKEIWRTTYAVTPGEPNIYQEYKSCEEGKVINEETGNCVKVTEVAVKTCAEGQYLNPLTGRCKKIEEEKETGCKDGYEMNPLTGRCIKIKVNDGADYSLVQESYEESSSFVAIYAVIGVVIVGLVYAGWEFRYEIRRLLKTVWRRFRR